MNRPVLNKTALSLRAIRIDLNNVEYDAIEILFAKWTNETLYAAAINRWIAEIGARP